MRTIDFKISCAHRSRYVNDVAKIHLFPKVCNCKFKLSQWVSNISAILWREQVIFKGPGGSVS